MLPFNRMNGSTTSAASTNVTSRSNHSTDSGSAIELTVAKLRKQRAALQEKDSQHAKYEQLAHRLELASACFVCGHCLAYSTWDPQQLGQHAASEHEVAESVCPYCLTQTPVAEIGEHQLRHFAAATAQDLYPCPHCLAYLEDKTAFLNHCHGIHSGRLEDCVCSCCGQVFGSAIQLAAHLEESVRPLYHCEVPGCLVKSASKLAVQRHLAKRHPSQPATAIISVDYLACAARPVSFLSLPKSSEDSDRVRGEHPVPTAAGSLPSVPRCGPSVFNLRCPSCPFATVSFAKFARHLSGDCRKAGHDDEGTGDAGRVAYRLFYCSECGAAATEASLILEHIACAHADIAEATLLQEDISASRVQLAKPIDDEPPPPPQQPQQPQQQQQQLQLVRKRPLDEPSSASAAVAASSVVGSASTKFARLDAPADSGSTTTEYVSFPFHEDAYRAARPATPATEAIIAKMKLFCGYKVRILGRENQRRIPECPECKRAFPYGLGDFKRHLLSVHLGIPRDTVRDCLKFTQPAPGSNKGGTITLVHKSEAEDERGLPRPVRIDAFRHRVPLPFSAPVLRQLTQHFSSESQDYLMGKMATYCTLHVIVDARNGKKYLCGSCNYASPHALADVRKHILGAHCGISTKHFRYCLQASRLDPAEYTLLTDEKLIRLAREFVRVRQFGEGGAAGSSEDAEDLIMLDPDAAAVLEPPTASQQQPLTPASTDGNPAGAASGLTDAAKNAMLHFGQNPSHFEEADGVDEEEVINLPFSEAVLRHLLRDACDRPHQDSLVTKMHAYGKYQLVRQIARGKTVAYKCICGRVFHTVRRPGNSVRPSTLADARRHVMGVHARISHEMLTTCCQASRISRENNWHLYSDDMLLRLANERPAKASASARSLDDSSVLSNHNSQLEESGCGDDSSSMTAGEAQPLGDEATKKQQKTEFSSLLYSSHPVWPGVSSDASKMLKSSSSAALGLIADLEQRVVASSSPSASPAGAAAAGLSSTSTPTLGGGGGGLSRSEPPIQPHEVATQEQRLASLRVLEEEGELERAVELPYSFTALQMLIDVPCDSDTMAILREKMEYYSTYKVAVTRTASDNKRVFRCSGCPASSPHGMGDIRKHILGVHAKVPDRYKTACLHASRLSRDDNRLLPDPLLIQLARLKWKGTVGPNDEKVGSGGGTGGGSRGSATEVSAATAVTASSVSYDCFPSMVPLRPAGSSTSSAAQHAAVSTAPAASGGSSASPTKGLRIKIKTTGTDQQEVVAATSDDNANPDEEDSSSSGSGIPPEMHCPSDRPQIPTTCFVIQADDTEKPLPPGKCQFTCSWCEFGSHNVGPVRGHIVRDHLRIPGHKCSVCGKLYAVRNHVFRHHLLEHQRREFHLLQYSAYRYAMNRVDVKPASQAKRILQRSAAAIAAAKTRREAAAAASAAAAAAAVAANSSSRKRPRLESEEDAEQDNDQEGDDEDDDEDFDDAGMQVIEDDGGDQEAEEDEEEEVEPEEEDDEINEEEGEEDEVETEAQEDEGNEAEDSEEEDGDGEEDAGPASVMVNGKELLLMPDSLDRAVHPAPLARCWVVRKRGNFGGVTYHCSVCTGSSSSLNSVKDHIVQYHLGVFPHHCHLCRRSFWSRDVLDGHFSDAHPGERPKSRPPQAYKDALQGLPIRAPGGGGSKQVDSGDT